MELLLAYRYSRLRPATAVLYDGPFSELFCCAVQMYSGALDIPKRGHRSRRSESTGRCAACITYHVLVAHRGYRPVPRVPYRRYCIVCWFSLSATAEPPYSSRSVWIAKKQESAIVPKRPLRAVRQAVICGEAGALLCSGPATPPCGARWHPRRRHGRGMLSARHACLATLTINRGCSGERRID